MLPTYPTLLHALSSHALDGDTNLKGFSFIRDNELAYDFVSYKELYQTAGAVAGLLEGYRNEPVMLLFTNGKEFIQALLACWAAGVIAVPCPVPQRPSQFRRLQQMALRDGITKCIISRKTYSRISKRLNAFNAAVFSFIWWEDCCDAGVPQTGFSMALPEADDIALIQYTSGSTAQPKGIIITHGNFAANCQIIQQAFELTHRDCSVCWVPHYHDMGLVDGLLEPLYTGFNAVHIPATLFLQTPSLWLRAIHAFKATYTGGPNFAYDLCTKKIRVEEVHSFPATHLRVMYNAAEPIQWKTIERFAQKFESVGYPLSIHNPGYGLAEATLAVSFSKLNGEPHFFYANTEKLKRHQLEPDHKGKEIVACGVPGLSTTVKIADAFANFLQEGAIGEVWINSPSVTHKGYWKNAAATAETYVIKHDAEKERLWLRTGDLGFLWNNHLYITGREKDLIQIYGQNIYPQDIEYSVKEALHHYPLGRSAAFQIEKEGPPKIVLVQEVSKSLPDGTYAEIIKKISHLIFTEHGISLYDILLVPKAEVLVTTSGKVQRQANKRQYEADLFFSIASFQKNKFSHA